MKNTKHPIAAVTAVAALAAAAVLAGCAANETPAAERSASDRPASASAPSAAPALAGTLGGSGATSVQAAQQAWVAAFQSANPGVTVNYAPEGSGAGRSAFAAGAVAFAGSDRALKADELGAGKFAGCAPTSSALDLPVYISPIAVVANIEGVTDLTLDPATIAGVFAGQITSWDDPAIKATNAAAALPHAPITVVHRADDSGTTANFTDTLAALAPDAWTWGSVSTWPAELKGEAATGTSGMVASVSGGKNAIGYADASQAKALTQAAILIGGTPTKPTAQGAAALVDQSPREPGRGPNDLAIALDRTAAGVYPAALVSYLIVCETYRDPAQAGLVRAYVDYIGSDAGQQAAATAAGSAPLSATMQDLVRAAAATIK